MRKIFLCFLLMPCFLVCPIRYWHLTRRQWLKMYAAYVAQSYGIDDRIIHAVIQWESGWKEKKIEWQRGQAISFGLGQNSPETAYEYFSFEKLPRLTRMATIQWLYDGKNNIEVLCWNLWRHKKRYGGDIKKALSAHNMGVGGFYSFQRRTGRPYYNRYVTHIWRIMERMERDFGF